MHKYKWIRFTPINGPALHLHWHGPGWYMPIVNPGNETLRFTFIVWTVFHTEGYYWDKYGNPKVEGVDGVEEYVRDGFHGTPVYLEKPEDLVS